MFEVKRWGGRGGWSALVAGALLVSLAWQSLAGATEPMVKDGQFHLRLHYQYLPTNTEIASLLSTVEQARMQLCDATDGQAKIGGVTLSFGAASEQDGDVWLMPLTGRSYANLNHVTLFREGTGYSNETLAHELGHYLFRLKDSYREDIRANGCGQGPNFDEWIAPLTVAPDQFTGAMSPVDNTIMQSAVARCRLLDGRSLGDLNPDWEQPCRGDLDCYDCTACAGLPSPPASIQTVCGTNYSSEFTVEDNFDMTPGTGGVCPAPAPAQYLFVRASLGGGPTPGPANELCGNGVTDAGEQCDPSDTMTPLPLCTDFGLEPLITGNVNVRCNSNCTYQKGSGSSGPCVGYYADVDGEQCALSAGREEACVDGSAVPVVPPGSSCGTFGFSNGSLSCRLCSLDLGSCGPPPASCGDGVLDAGEQCDMGDDNGNFNVPAADANGVPLTCERFYGPSGASAFLTCDTNCTFDKFDCNHECLGTVGQPEACTALGGEQVPPASCADYGFGSGQAACQGCSLSLAACGPEVMLDGSSFDAARDSSSVVSPWLLAVDGLGEKHAVRLYAAPLAADLWRVNVVGLGEEYVGGGAGRPQHLRTFELRFDPATDEVIAVKSGLGAEVAGSVGTFSLGGQATDGSGEGSPAFVSGPFGQAPRLDITVDFSAVTSQRWLRYDDVPGSPTGPNMFLSGTTFASGPSPEQKVVARCTEPSWCGLWDANRGSWEGTAQQQATVHEDYFKVLRESDDILRMKDAQVGLSDWEAIRPVVAERYSSKGLVVDPPGDKPFELPPNLTECGGPLEWDDSAVVNLSPDGVVLVLDRSHSMITPVDAGETYGTGSGESRMAFAQAATRDFLDHFATRPGTRAQVGLVSYESTASAEQSIVELATGAPAAGQVELSQFKAVVDTLQPQGRTAIGLALREAGDLFAGSSLAAKAIVLLSDGQNNEPEPLGEFDPLAVAQAIAAEGIRVYTVPTGNAADKMLMAEIARITGGAMFHAQTGDELPTTLAEAYARASGEDLVLRRTSISVQGANDCGIGEFPCGFEGEPTPNELGCACLEPGQAWPVKSVSFDVDQSTTRLNVLLSVRNKDISTWHPQFKLVDPQGNTRLDHNSPEVMTDDFYRILSVTTPEQGAWTLHVGANGLPVQHQYVQAHAEGAGPGCSAEAIRTVVGPGEPAIISASATYGGRAINKPTLFADLIRPDGSSFVLSFGQAAQWGERSLTIDPSLLTMRGIYRVDVRCQVANDSAYTYGEGAPGPEEGGLVNGSPGFVRRTTVSFFADVSGQIPLDPSGDYDNNGIPNDLEDDVDTDGDGLPDAYDEDDDGDDLPDFLDPDPKDPFCQVPACPVADAGDDQILECTALGTAPATLDASNSSDPDGQALTYDWTANVPLTDADQAVASGIFPLGTTDVTLTVSDGPNSISDSVLITVLDTTPPTLVAPADVVASTCGSVHLGQPTASDSCGGAVTVVHDAPASFKAGKTVVTWYAIDQLGNVAQATQNVIVGLGDNPACCPLGTTVLVGTPNNDTLIGTAGSDCILGLGAQDVIKGMGGDDYLSGGHGNDNLEGGDGHDYIEGGSGQDTLRGQFGDDIVLGNDGDDLCYGGPGHDWLHGGQGQDKLYGFDGDDRLYGNDGDDRLEGEAGNDLLDGGGLHDVCIGGPGTNVYLTCEVQQ